jgi:hypothetical protein
VHLWSLPSVGSPPKFSKGKKLVDLVKKIDGLFNKTKEHYADQLVPVKRNQIGA